MFSLPIIFLVNAVTFVLILEERFKTVTTLCVTAAALLLSFITNIISGNLLIDPAISAETANMLSIFWLLLASVFTSSNNIVHKIYTGLVLLTNYIFFTDFISVLLAKRTGMLGILLCNGIYILLSLVVIAALLKPMHYFCRRGVSFYNIGICLMQVLALYVAKGGANSFFGTDSFSMRFFITLIIYLFTIFSIRGAYGCARFKAKDIYRAADNDILNVRADSFNNMLVNVESYKNARSNVIYAFDKLDNLAKKGRTEEISEFVSRAEADNTSPLLQFYSENPYINAVVATKAAEAYDNDIYLESNISIGETKFKTIEICIVLNDILTWAINDSKTASGDKSIRLNVLPAKNQLTIETVHSSGTSEEEEKFTSKTFGSYVKALFEEESENNDQLKSVKHIVEKYSGHINISETDSTTITRIGINYQ